MSYIFKVRAWAGTKIQAICSVRIKNNFINKKGGEESGNKRDI